MKVLLTGCSRGLGRAILDELLSGSHEVIGISRKSPQGVAKHSRFKWVQMDLMRTESISHELELISGSFTPEMVIHNAGLGMGGLSIDSDPHQPEMMKLNFEAPATISKFLIKRALATNRTLRIVHVSSIAAHVPFPGVGGYAASKAALEAMGRAFSIEWRRFGIQVLNICPDYIETDMTASQLAEVKKQIAEDTPGSPLSSCQEVAKALVAEATTPNPSWLGKSLILSKRRHLEARQTQVEWREI